MQTVAKNIVLSLGLGLMFFTAVHLDAQNTFGIRGGLNASNISFDKLSERGERLGFHVGVFADVPVVPDFFSLQPELSYSIKGTAYDVLNERQSLNMNYVDFHLPVAFKLSTVDLQVGPFASYLISKPDFTVFDENRVVVDAFNAFDAGLTAGLSFNFNKVLLGIRYNQGFVNVSKDNAETLLGKGKNAVGQVSLGYRF